MPFTDDIFSYNVSKLSLLNVIKDRNVSLHYKTNLIHSTNPYTKATHQRLK